MRKRTTELHRAPVCDFASNRVTSAVQRFRAFTLIEIALSIFILLLLLLLAVPSLTGVIASRRVKKNFDSFHQLLRPAQESSGTGSRSYFIVLGKKIGLLWPGVFSQGED